MLESQIFHHLFNILSPTSASSPKNCSFWVMTRNLLASNHARSGTGALLGCHYILFLPCDPQQRPVMSTSSAVHFWASCFWEYRRELLRPGSGAPPPRHLPPSSFTVHLNQYESAQPTQFKQTHILGHLTTWPSAHSVLFGIFFLIFHSY